MVVGRGGSLFADRRKRYSENIIYIYNRVHNDIQVFYLFQPSPKGATRGRMIAVVMRTVPEAGRNVWRGGGRGAASEWAVAVWKCLPSCCAPHSWTCIVGLHSLPHCKPRSWSMTLSAWRTSAHCGLLEYAVYTLERRRQCILSR